MLNIEGYLSYVLTSTLNQLTPHDFNMTVMKISEYPRQEHDPFSKQASRMILKSQEMGSHAGGPPTNTNPQQSTVPP